MGYFRDLHTNPDGSCITCNTQQLAYQDYKGCLCSIIDDVGADVMNRIIKLLEEWPICKDGCYCLSCDLGETEGLKKEFAELLALIKGEN